MAPCALRSPCACLSCDAWAEVGCPTLKKKEALEKQGCGEGGGCRVEELTLLVGEEVDRRCSWCRRTAPPGVKELRFCVRER